jgi:pimeloyl-ACP methyl ester carboxylesterase
MSPKPARAAHIVFVHGLWMPGFESRWFRRRLEAAADADSSVFTYRTTREPLSSILDRLAGFVVARHARTLHLVGHSLGGLVLLRLLQRSPTAEALPPGRVVLLGSPVCGSRAAARLEALPFGRALLGRVAVEGLLRPALGQTGPEPLCSWTPPRGVGVIAGTRPIGLGRLLARFDEPNDGTVALRETRFEAARDRLVLPVSHMGMLMSARVVEETAHFLREGRFGLRPH